MQLVIDRATGTVTIDGVSYSVDLIELQPEIVRVTWSADHGSVSYADGTTTGLGDWLRFRSIVNRWYHVDQALRTR